LYQYQFIREQVQTNIKSRTTENKPHNNRIYFVLRKTEINIRFSSQMPCIQEELQGGTLFILDQMGENDYLIQEYAQSSKRYFSETFLHLPK